VRLKLAKIDKFQNRASTRTCNFLISGRAPLASYLIEFGALEISENR